MVEVGVEAGGCPDGFTLGRWCIMWDGFLCIWVAGARPAVDFLWDGRVVRLAGADADDGMSHFREVAVDALDAVQVAEAWSSSEPGEGHHCRLDIETSDLDHPLESTDE